MTLSPAPPAVHTMSLVCSVCHSSSASGALMSISATVKTSESAVIRGSVRDTMRSRALTVGFSAIIVHSYLLLPTPDGTTSCTFVQVDPPLSENSSVTPFVISPAACQVTVWTDPRFQAVASFGFVIRIPAIVYASSDISWKFTAPWIDTRTRAAAEITSGSSFAVPQTYSFSVLPALIFVTVANLCHPAPFNWSNPSRL